MNIKYAGRFRQDLPNVRQRPSVKFNQMSNIEPKMYGRAEMFFIITEICKIQCSVSFAILTMSVYLKCVIKRHFRLDVCLYWPLDTQHILISFHPFSKGHTHVILKYDPVYCSIDSML